MEAVSKLIDYFRRGLDDPEQFLLIVASWKNEKTSPAFSIHCMESVDTFHRQLENMTETKRLYSLNSAEWE